jgi:hypothetical protein
VARMYTVKLRPTYCRVQRGINFCLLLVFGYGQWLSSELRCPTYMHGESWGFLGGGGRGG